MRAWRALATATLMALSTAALANIAVEVMSGVDQSSPPLAFRGASWVSAVPSGARSWFRLPLVLDHRPDAVSITLDADQTYTLFVNGIQVDEDNADLRSGTVVAHAVDLTGLMVVGENVIGVRVVNNDHRPASLRARVALAEGGVTRQLLTGTAQWRATSDVSSVETPGLGPTSMTWPGRPGTGGIRLVPGQSIVPGTANQLGQVPPHRIPVTLLPPGQATSAHPSPAPALAVPQQNALGSIGATAQGPLASGATAPPATPSPLPSATPRPLSPMTGQVPVTVGITPRLQAQEDAGNFSIPGFADPAWGPAEVVPAPRGDVPGTVPSWVVDTPLQAAVVTAAEATSLVAVAATIEVPSGPADGWVRIGAAGGQAAVFLDGTRVVPLVGATQPTPDTFSGAGTSGADPWRQPSPPRNVPRQSTGLRAAVAYISAYHLGPLLHPGRNLLMVVASGTTPSVYVDGRIEAGGRTSWIGTSPLWMARARPGSPRDLPSAPAQELGNVVAAWGNRPPVVPMDSSTMRRPEAMLWVPRLLVVAVVVGSWLLVAQLAWLRRRAGFLALLAIGALGTVGGLLATEITQELARLPSFRPPGLLVWPTLVTLLAITVVGDVAATACSLHRGRQGRARSRRREAVTARLRGADAPPAIAVHARVSRRSSDHLGAMEAFLAPPFGGRRPVLGCALATASGTVHPSASAPAISQPVLPPALSRVLSLAEWLRGRFDRLFRSWSSCAVALIAVGSGALNAYRLDYQPFWQDELFSLAGARGVRQHVLPIWPSGFQYWKGEIYSLIIAVVGRVAGDSPTTLRMVSVALFAATVAVFGLLLAPEVLGRQRRWLIVAVTLLFATAPAQLSWAREARMYQLADFFMVLFLALFLRALRSPTTRNIVLAAAALLAMYLSHEETFIALPAVAMVGVLALRSQLWRNPRWVLIAAVTFAVIGAQALLAFRTQPQWFGFDHSNRPYIGFDTTDAWYYLSTVFFKGSGGLALTTTLATVASIVGLCRADRVRNVLTGFLWIEVFMLSVVFTPRIPRYTFIVLPPLFLLAVLGIEDLVSAVRHWITPLDAPLAMRRVTQAAATAALGLGIVWLGVSQPVSIQAYGLAVADALHSPYQMQYVDYPVVVEYMKRHWRPGDLFVVAAPPNIPAEYFGRPPDRVIQTRANDRFFYMFEKNGKAVDTEFGVPIVLSPSDLQRLLETHRRIWLVTDDTRYLSTLPPGFIDVVNSHFVKVAEGATAAVYLGYG